MKSISLKVILYRQLKHIALEFPNDPALNLVARKCKGLRWSKSNGCWVVPLSRSNYQSILRSFAAHAQIDSRRLRDYINSEAPAGASTLPDSPITLPERPVVPGQAIRDAITALARQEGIDPVNRHVIPAMEERLKLRAYSRSTIKTYLNEIVPLLRLLKKKAADELTEAEIKRYLVYCYEKLKLSENTLHSRINALKFYYEQVLGKNRFFWDIPRPKRPLQLPKLLNEDELARLFNSLSNKKHKAMLFTAYSAGLRVSEIVNLKLTDIDSGRMQILVARAKGKKDRYVNLSPVLLDILREYIKTYHPRPKVFLFESEQTGTAYPTRTVQQIFSNAKAKAFIKKPVGIHSLRHSFATHLLDKGTDIRYIKDILGHFNIKTTERYLHVSKMQLVNIVSPFDELFKSRDIHW